MKRTIFLTVLAFIQVLTGLAQEDPEYNTRIEITYQVKEINRINTADAEFGGVIQGNDFIFVSDREYDLVQYGESRWKKKRTLNLFKAGFNSPKDDSVIFSKVSPYRDRLPDYFHEGPICFHPTGNYAVITRVVTQRKTNKPKLYLVKKEAGKWSKPERLSFCENDFSYGHACFSEDGKTLYFSSDQLGSIGGKDIFSCSFDAGKFGAPFNLGPNINSTNDEMYPFIQNNRLYFSSDQPGTMGGLDVFKSEWKNNGFEKAVNLGSTLNSNADDFSFYLTTSGRNGFMASNRPGKGGDDLYFFTVKETAVILSKNINGKFTYTRMQEGFPNGLDLQLLDEAGNIIQTARTDENGGFKFSSLPPDQNYTIKVVNLGEDLTLHIFNRDGEEVAVLMSDRKGSFVYKKLEPAEVGTLSFMELEDSDINGNKMGKISGQFMHERLKGEPLGSMKIMLVDEAGNIYVSTVTDKNGNFTFSKLPSDQNFYIKADSPYDDLKLLIYNSKDEVIADLKRRGDGPFIFRRIDSKLENSLTFIDNEDLQLFPSSYMNLEGKFNFNQLDGNVKSLGFLVTDEAGNMLTRGTTDNKGNFILTGLKPEEVYIFKLDDKDAGLVKKGMKLEMLNRYDQQLQMIDASEAGLYVFDRKPKVPFKPQDGVVYFEKNSSDLSPEAKEALKPYIAQLKADPTLIVQLDGHADASYHDAFNMQLSMRRMLNTKQYFVHNGISSKRIRGFYHGEAKLANTACADASQCSDQENRLNRRCEVRVFKP